MYAGIGGLAPVLAEIGQYRAVSAAEQVLATGIVARLSAMAHTRAEPSLYSGLGGDVTALRLLAPGSERVALQRLAELMTPAGWNTTVDIEPASTAPVTDLVLGAAGVVLAAIWAGGEHARQIAATGGEWLLRAADQTKDGLDWGILPGWPSRMPNYSHGTAGIATALAIAGAALDRDDFIAAARQGAQHLLAVGSLDDGGFVVPHTLPYSSRDVDAVTYTWCHGPAGRRARGRAAAATVPALGPCLRCPTAASAGFLGQRRPLLRHRRGGGRPARRRTGLHGPGASRHAAGGGAHHGRRPRRARHPRPGRGTVAVP